MENSSRLSYLSHSAIQTSRLAIAGFETAPFFMQSRQHKSFHRSTKFNGCSVTGRQRLNRVGCRKYEEDSGMVRKEDSPSLLNSQCIHF